MKKTIYYLFSVAWIIFLTGNILSAQKIAGGCFHSLFLCDNTTANASGMGGWGQLGHGINSPKDSIPVQVSLPGGITAISAGGNHSLFLKNDSTVWGCGYNFFGQLGDGTHFQKYTPVQVTGLTGITAISAGRCHSLFLKNDSTAWACGKGYGYNAHQISGLAGIIAVSAGRDHSLFLKNDGTVWACGENIYGQLGDGTNKQRTIPVQVTGLTGITAIAGGGDHSLFLRNDDGTVWSCGGNLNGQLGDGTTTQRNIPVQVIGLTGITAMAAGKTHSLFLKNDGTVWACGNNAKGQLGDGTNTQRITPVQVSGLTGITDISAGWFHSLFLEKNDIVWACGKNMYGELGDGTTIQRNIPVKTRGLCLMTGAEEIINLMTLLVFPNPATGKFIIESSEKISSFSITNLLGEKVYQQAISDNGTANSITVDLSSQSKGIYFIDMLPIAIGSGSERRTRKIILE